MRDYDKVAVDAGAIVDCGHRVASLVHAARVVHSASLDGGATVRRDVSANAAASLAAELLTVRALLRARARYFERHVLGWYALGRVQEAHAAWSAVCEMRHRVADMELDPTSPVSALDAFLRGHDARATLSPGRLARGNASRCRSGLTVRATTPDRASELGGQTDA
jgi:hypothetical protein